MFFDIGCVKIHLKWYRMCKQKRTTFLLLLFTMMTLCTYNPIIPAFSWRHNVFINLNINLSSSLTLFYTINLLSIYVLVNVTGIILRWAFNIKTSIKNKSYKWKYSGALKCMNKIPLNTHSYYVTALETEVATITFVLNFIFCLFYTNVIFEILLMKVL